MIRVSYAKIMKTGWKDVQYGMSIKPSVHHPLSALRDMKYPSLSSLHVELSSTSPTASI